MSSLVSKVIVNGEECNEVRYSNEENEFESLKLNSNILNDQTTINNDTKGYSIFDREYIYSSLPGHSEIIHHTTYITKVFTANFAIPICNGCYLITTPQYCKRVFNLFVEKDDKILLGNSEEIMFDKIWGKFYTSEKDKRYMLYYNPDAAIFYLIKKTIFDAQTPIDSETYYRYSPRVYIVSIPRTLTFNGKEEIYDIGEMVKLDEKNNKVFFKIYNFTNETGYTDSYTGVKDNITSVSLDGSNFIEEYTNGMERDLGTEFNCNYNIDFKLKKHLFKKKIDCKIKDLSSEYWLNLPFRYSDRKGDCTYDIESIFIRMKVFILNSDDCDTWNYINTSPDPNFDFPPRVDGGFKCLTKKVRNDNGIMIGRNYILYNNDDSKNFFGYFYNVPENDYAFADCKKLYYFYRNSNCSSMEMYIPTEILGLYYFTTTTNGNTLINDGGSNWYSPDLSSVFFPYGKGRLYKLIRKYNSNDFYTTVNGLTYYFNFHQYTSIFDMYSSVKAWKSDAEENYPNYFLNSAVKKTISHIKVN